MIPDEALQLIVNAVQKAGYAPGNDVMIAIDAAASELYEESRNVYYFPGESRQCGKTVFRDTAEMVAYYEELIEKYPDRIHRRRAVRGRFRRLETDDGSAREQSTAGRG